MKIILNHLKELIYNSNLTIKTLSIHTGISYNKLINYLNGRTKIPADDFEKICNELNVNPIQLLNNLQAAHFDTLIHLTKEERSVLEYYRTLSRKKQNHLFEYLMKPK